MYMISAGVLFRTWAAVRISLLYVVPNLLGNRCPNASQLCRILVITHALSVFKRTEMGASLFSWPKLKNLMQPVYRFFICSSKSSHRQNRTRTSADLHKFFALVQVTSSDVIGVLDPVVANDDAGAAVGAAVGVCTPRGPPPIASSVVARKRCVLAESDRAMI